MAEKTIEPTRTATSSTSTAKDSLERKVYTVPRKTTIAAAMKSQLSTQFWKTKAYLPDHEGNRRGGGRMRTTSDVGDGACGT